MLKKLSLIIAVCISVSFFTGCWNYRGLDKLSIVTGFAIDKKDDIYQLTFEIIDLGKSSKETGITTKIVETEGKTIFDGIRKANTKNNNKLYFSSTETVIVSHQIVAEDGLNSVIDFLVRDAELRENIIIVISQEDSASEVLKGAEANSIILSYDINQIITEDNATIGATVSDTLYEVINNLNSQGSEILLPAIHLVESGEDKVVEVNGTAIFSSDRLVGFLSPEDTTYLLMINNDLSGGILTCCSTKDNNVTFEIKKTTTKRSFEYKNDKLKIILKPSFEVALAEMSEHKDLLDIKVIEDFEAQMKTHVSEEMHRVIKLMQTEYKVDAFNFGNHVYKNDLSLWREIHEKWPEMFQELEVEIEVKVQIINSAYLFD